MKRYIVLLAAIVVLSGISGMNAAFADSHAQIAPDISSVVEKGLVFEQSLMKKRFDSMVEERKGTSLHYNLQDRRWQLYRRWKMASRGGFVNSPTITMEATAYDPGPISCGPYANGRTATGMHAEYGIAAVDPTVIPLGTHLYVEGYGYAIAADIGSAIKGYRIDLCFNTYREAIQYGRRVVRVYILGR